MKTSKVFASVLAFAMAATMAAGSASAAGEKVTISAEKVEAAAGSEFSVAIKLSDVPTTGIMGCEFAVTYDASVLTVSSVTAGEIAETGSDSAESDISSECPAFYTDLSTEGTINLTWSTGLTDSSYWISKDGVFATITGTVKSDAAAGEYPIEIVPISRQDISGTNSSIFIGYIDSNSQAVEYTSATSNGAVVVTAAGTTATTTTPVGGTTTTTTNTTGSVASGDVLYGDTNLDGTVSILDVIYLSKYLAKAIQFNDQQMTNADVVADGNINAADATALLQYIVRLVKELPQQVQ
jgi:hypothetical protein